MVTTVPIKKIADQQLVGAIRKADRTVHDGNSGCIRDASQAVRDHVAIDGDLGIFQKNAVGKSGFIATEAIPLGAGSCNHSCLPDRRIPFQPGTLSAWATIYGNTYA
ncbi:hypothetical protein A9R05_42940 (plasmid) [Burkholderia sp. KK1]|nr:hypothetical protein A9R05_42940 [Burkholderia sp. KK1]